MPLKGKPVNNVRTVINRADWYQDRVAAVTFSPSLSTDGVATKNIANEIVVFTVDLLGTGAAINPKIFGWDGSTWLELEDLGALTANTSNGVQYAFLLQGLGSFLRLSTGVVSIAGTGLILTTKFGFLEGR